MSSVGKKPVREATPVNGQPLGSVDKKKFPTLIDYLTLTAYDDGQNRQTATVTIFVENGQVKACLNDRDLDRAGWVTVQGLASVLDDLETALADGSLDWRQKKPYHKGRK